MKEASRRHTLIIARSKGCVFVFDWRGLQPEQENIVLPDWPRRKTYGLVSDRIIQKYLEQQLYNIEVLVYPFSITMRIGEELLRVVKGKVNSESGMLGRSAGRTICFLGLPSTEPCDEFRNTMNYMQSIMTLLGPGVQGVGMANVMDLHTSVQILRQVHGFNDTPFMTIKEVSDHFWPWVSKNLKGTIHNWMQGIPYKDRERIPLFRPAIQVKKADSKGCRLSTSDTVTIGLLASLLIHGCQSYHFGGPNEFQFFDVDELASPINYLRASPLGRIMWGEPSDKDS